MKNFFLILLCYTVCCSCKVNHNFFSKIEKGKPFTMQGYLINIYGEYGVWIFQPCTDSSISVLEVRGTQSFFVQDMVNDLGYTFLRDAKDIGKKVPVLIYDHTTKKTVEDTIQYLYCKLTVNPVDLFRKVDDCAYTIKYENTEKELACWAFENYVTKLEPLDPIVRDKYSKSHK